MPFNVYCCLSSPLRPDRLLVLHNGHGGEGGEVMEGKGALFCVSIRTVKLATQPHLVLKLRLHEYVISLLHASS
jgi:hypothetical protein